MEQKNRLLLSILIIALVVGAMFTSFGRDLFAMNTPQIQLPQTDSSQGGGAQEGEDDDSYLKVEVTPDTVQGVISTLERTDSYFRELTVERHWPPQGSSTSQLRVWKDQGWTLVRQLAPSGSIRWDMVGPQNAWTWYEGGRDYLTLPVDRLSADLAQLIPTYETVLDMDPQTITAAGYEDRGGQPCVYVQAEDQELGRTLRYWVNIGSGLLISAETEQDGVVIYSMTGYTAIQSPCPATAKFSLPDGTSLHTP